MFLLTIFSFFAAHMNENGLTTIEISRKNTNYFYYKVIHKLRMYIIVNPINFVLTCQEQVRCCVFWCTSNSIC